MGWSGDWMRARNDLLMEVWAGRQRIGFGRCDWTAAGGSERSCWMGICEVKGRENEQSEGRRTK
jgi:hypothetical protein